MVWNDSSSELVVAATGEVVDVVELGISVSVTWLLLELLVMVWYDVIVVGEVF